MGKKGEKDNKLEKAKTLSIDEKNDLAMEAGSRLLTQMPNLPKPLTLEEKKFLLAVERGDCNTTRKMLQKAHRHQDYMNMNCVDPLGRGALHMSISNENQEMVEMLVVMGVETGDALLHAIDAEFVEAVEVLLEHEEVIHKEGDDYSWEKADRNTSAFTPEITPLILAAHRDNYEILKILLDRGATLPMPHDIKCGCPECIRSSSEDSLRYSRSRINAYRALASPSLIALSSTDPILTAFQLSLELKSLAYTEHEFRADYLELRSKCMKFAEELLSHARSSTELAVMLNHDPDSVVPYEEGTHMMLKRLELAIDCNQKRFVAHPNIQQLLAALWYEGVPGFRRKTVIEKSLEILKVVVLFPFYCMWYMFLPDTPTGKLIRTPFMKFLTHSSSYLFFLMLLILVSVRFENLVIWLFGTEQMKLALEKSMRRQRGNLPTPTECIVALWVFGFLWEEVKEIHKHSFHKYIKNMWNLMDILRDSLYVITMLLRLFAYIQQNQEIAHQHNTAFIPREEWDTFDPQLISEGLFAAANILSALKLVHIFSINPYLGPLQISLGRMVIDIVKFFFIYTLVLFAFACGLTQLLWYYNDLEKQKCYSLPGGMPDWTKQGDACMKWRRFHNLFEASQSLFWAGFGMVGLEDFELTGIREYTRFWSMLMFGAYSVINIIVLLNLLIAMMSNSYSFIVEHADTEWKFARTKLWMSYFEEGNTLPPPFNIFPTFKTFLRMCGKHSEKSKLVRSMSSRSHNRHMKARDYRYLSVMRALIWRYVCSLQRRNEERPVNEDDISEVKGDISSLRFELIDLFGHNGMDISMCAKKSRAAMGRKMRVWERRLMRDFHVSPAMGSEDTIDKEEVPAAEESAGDKFRRVARLAIAKTASEMSQIGMGDAPGRENLKVAMEKARRKMEEGTPDGSPGSSRGCSPFPDLYTGPHLLDAIKSLDLSPNASPSQSPMPPYPDGNRFCSAQGKVKDGQAKDPNMLTVPGRRSSTTLNREGGDVGPISLDVPVPRNVKDSLLIIKKKAEPEASKAEKKSTKPPATISTVSETKAPKVQQKDVNKDEAQVQKKESAPQKPVAQIQQQPGAVKPSQAKPSGQLPINNQQKSEGPAPPKLQQIGRLPIKDPSAVRIPPPAAVGARRGPDTEHALRRPAAPRVQQVQQQTFTGSDDLETVDFVRRPSRPPPKQESDVQSSPPPTIAVIPSTPKPTETPVPPSPPSHKPFVKPQAPAAPKAPVEKPPTEKIPVEKAPAEKVSTEKKTPSEKVSPEKAPAEKVSTEKKTPSEKVSPEKAPAEKVSPEIKSPQEKSVSSSEQKPSTPPAATFHNNASSTPSRPLLAPTPTEEKKGGWL
ncbi:transient-receptor-potential-like protein [Homarus americanus]|uniref:transient-receptor-potential-like protein n=1 Tax=Homarus americanus TaxID=6706 RepID=UPI001C465D91|nr:transient-receptor-potential-like protein [Homarus americanus]